MNAALKEKLKTLPRTPGVYFHKSKDDEIIYIGKAAILKNRVRRYFQSKADMDFRPGRTGGRKEIGAEIGRASCRERV